MDHDVKPQDAFSKNLWLPFAAAIAIVLALIVYIVWFPPAALREAGMDQAAAQPAQLTADLPAGSGFLSSIGNPEGLKPGEVIDYAQPAGVIPGKLLFAGSWRSDASGMVHVGGGNGLVIAGFSAREVVARLDADIPVSALIFYDKGFVPERFAGDDISFDGQRSYVNVTSARDYDLLKDVPAGEHLVVLATGVEELSFGGFRFS